MVGVSLHYTSLDTSKLLLASKHTACIDVKYNLHTHYLRLKQTAHQFNYIVTSIVICTAFHPFVSSRILCYCTVIHRLMHATPTFTTITLCFVDYICTRINIKLMSNILVFLDRLSRSVLFIPIVRHALHED